MYKAHLRSIVAPMLLALLVIGIWSIVTLVGNTPEFLLPNPGLVFTRLLAELSYGYLWSYLSVTLVEAICGAALGAAFALPLAYLIDSSKWVNAGVQPFLGATQAIPAVAIAPLLLLWVGSGTVSIVLLCALIVFFPILVTTAVGLRHLDPDLLDAARLDGANRYLLLRYMQIPLTLPAILAGLRNGFTLSITGAVVGEMVMGGKGMGSLVVLQSHNVDTAGMFVSILVLATTASILYGLIYQIERHSKTVSALEGRRPN